MKIIKNKFIIVLILFVLWISFFDTNSLWRQRSTKKDIKKAKNEKQYYKNKFVKDSTLFYQLNTDKKNLEKFARQEYFMHKENETVVIFDEK